MKFETSVYNLSLTEYILIENINTNLGEGLVLFLVGIHQTTQKR